MWRPVTLVRTYVPEVRIASIFRVIMNSELGTLAVTSNCEELITLWVRKLSNGIFHALLRLSWSISHSFASQRATVTANVVLIRSLFSTWRWRRYIPPKRQFLQEQHGATPQKTAFFLPNIRKKFQKREDQLPLGWIYLFYNKIERYMISTHSIPQL
jgi:hypothetical protein